MITDLPPQVLSTPPKPVYALIQPYDPTPISKQEYPEPEELGGHFTIVSGTSNGTISTYMQFVPSEGKIPSLIIQLDNEGRLLENRPEYLIKQL